ncbi:MAG: hypothetical protein ACI4IE_00175 [Eubacterium sp.]
MKASKKLLSLFLAVVMVITSCSVGFTAFAADSKTDTNNAYWYDGTDAEAAFDSLNDLVDTYIPQLLNIPAVKSLLEDNLGMTITENTTVSDVVAGASPMLMGLLGGTSGDKQNIINNKLAVSTYDPMNEVYFSYIGGSDSDTMDFYSLYDFCSSNKNSSNSELKEYANSTLEKLDAILSVYPTARNAYDDSYAIGYEKFEDEYLPQIKKQAKDLYGVDDDQLTTLTLSQVKAMTMNGVKLEEINASGEYTDEDIETYTAYVNALHKAAGDGIEVKTAAETAYYMYCGGAYSTVTSILVHAIDLGGGTLTAESLDLMYHGKQTVSSYEKLTAANYISEVGKVYTLADMGFDEASLAADPALAEYANDLHDSFCAALTLAVIIQDEDGSYGVFGSSNYEEMCIGWLEYAGVYDDAKAKVEGEKITDEQLKSIMATAKAENWNNSADALDSYLASGDNVLSATATAYLRYLIGYKKENMVQFAVLLTNGTLEQVKAYKFGDGTFKLDDMGVVDRTNYMIASELCRGIIGDNYPLTVSDQPVDQGHVVNIQLAFNVITQFKENIEPNMKKDPNYKEYKYSDYAIPNSLAVEAVNSLLNKTLGNLLDETTSTGAMVVPIINKLLETNVKLYTADGDGVLNDIWKNLYEKPVETVFNLLPTLVILVDELIVPLFLNGSGDRYNTGGGPIFSLLCSADSDGILYKYTQDYAATLDPATATDEEKKNASIGIGALTFDLNLAIPAILHWLVGDEQTAYDLVGSYNSNGFYNDEVPRFLNIYVVDKALYGAHLNGGLAKTLINKKKESQGENYDSSYDKTAKGIDEMVTEIATFAMNAIDKYLADHASDPRWSEDTTSQKGINNIGVALPQILDQMGKDFVAKYNIDSDWTFCYDGKITTVSKTYKDKDYYQLQNNTLQDFKNLAVLGDPSAVLNNFVDIFIGNWINGLLDLVNDLVKDESNSITANIPIVDGLLNALGGFGEASVITDVVNGLFQLKRSDDASFTLKERDKTGFVGFSNESGFFLLSNIQYTKDGASKGLIPVIMELIKGSDTEADYKLGPVVNGTAKKTKSASPLLANSNKSAAGTDYSKLLSAENKKAADALVKTLDELLSSLLENTSLNGFDWDATDNILASIASFASGYLGANNTNAIVKLLNNYLYFIVGENKKTTSTKGKVGTAPTKDGDVDANKVYTSANLSNLVIQTYALIENIIDYLFYNKDSGLLKNRDTNMLVADALCGIISPDAVGVRMSDNYSTTADILAKKSYMNWNDFKVEITNANNTKGTWSKDYLKFGFKNGDKTAFYDALGESLGGVSAIIGVLLTQTNYYKDIVYPVMNSIAKANGVQKTVMSVADFKKASDSQKLIKGILTPLSAILDKIYDAPATMLLNTIKGLAGVLDDTSVKKIVNAAIAPLNNEIFGLANIVEYLSPTLAGVLRNALGSGISLTLPEKNVLTSLINGLLGGIIELPAINWKKFAAAKTPGEVLLYIYGYLVDTVFGSELLQSLLKQLSPEIYKLFKSLDAVKILTIINQVLKVVQSPTEVYWTFREYAAKLTNSFSYPNGITSSDADEAIGQLDDLVANIFPLLKGLGVADIDSLEQLVNDNLYTNDILTKLATALYGALDTDKIAPILGALGIDVSPKGIAKILTDKKYGKTYSSAAKTLSKAKSWKSVKSLNWGFTDKSSKAKTGFVNGLAAILRPFNDIASIFLAEGSIDASKLDIQSIIDLLNVKGSTNLGSGEYGCTLKYSIKNGILELTVQSNVTTAEYHDYADHPSQKNVVNVFKIDIKSIVKDIEAMLSDTKLNCGTNGYESAVIPLLEAFECRGVKTYKQYISDYKKAKDNLIINVLKPIINLVDDVLEAPFDTISAILPNVAYFIDSNGLAQAVGNLLAPVTAKNGLLGVLKKNGLDVDKLIKMIAGKDLGALVKDLLGLKVNFKLELNDLASCNIQDIIVPLVNKILKDKKVGIVVPNIDFGKIASHGTISTVSSKAKNDKGSYTRKKVTARQGEVLVAVLRYVADVLIKNASGLKKILCNIDAIKKNATISNVLKSVFTTIGTAEKDEIVCAVFYFLQEQTTNSFFDYSDFKYKEYDFSYGNMDEDFCHQLAPMLDGLISGLADLNALVADNIYKDEIISKMATGLYGAIEGVKISDDIGSLTNLLAQTDIDFSASNVASLLVNEDYGNTYPDAASVIRNAGSWKNVNVDDLKWGVKDRDTFLHALCAVLRPIYGVLDVLLNDGLLNLFNLVNIPGSDGYTSTIVPLMEAFGIYNIKTQYQYREDMYQAYDYILLDILNPLLDKVEDILSAPIQTLADILPNLSLFFANNGLLQLIDNLLTPVSALLKALRPIVDVNDLLKALGLNIPAELGKIGIKISKFDIYDLKGTLEPVIGSDNVVSLLNSILGIIKIKGTPLGLELPEIDWFRLASHGEVILDEASQVACYGSRISVKSDQDATLIAVLRYLVNTINYKGNYDAIVDLVGGLLGDNVSDSISDVIGQVLGMLQGDADEVIESLVDLLQTLA